MKIIDVKRSLNAILVVLLSLLFFSCQDDTMEINTTPNETKETLASTNINGLVRVKLNPELLDSFSIQLKSGHISSSDTEINTILDSIGTLTLKRTFPYSGKFEARSRENGLHLWYDISYDTTQVSLAEVLGQFENLSQVDITEPIRKIQSPKAEYHIIDATSQPNQFKSATAYPFNDTYLYAQWHYNNLGTVLDSEKDCDINLYEAWETQTGSSEVIVAIVDAGIDYDHEDLSSNMWINSAEKNGSSGADDDGNGYKDDVYGYNFVDDDATITAEYHGTHVAGTIAARNDNGKGVCGIAGGNSSHGGVKLMSCQVFETNDKGDEVSATNFAEAIKYAADNGAVICQNSWGYEDEASLPESMKEAIDYFIKYAGIDEDGNQVGPMAGGIMVFAAGNDNVSKNAYPAMYEPVIAVASVAADFILADYTNYGSWIDITAPGGAETSTEVYTNWIASTYPDNEYGYMIGTSMACPHVSGVAALVVSQYGSTGFTANDLKQKLTQGAVNLNIYNPAYENQYGAGLINAAAALENLLPEPEGNQSPIITSTENGSYTLKSHLTQSYNLSISDPDGDNFTWKYYDKNGASSAIEKDGDPQITIKALTIEPGTYSAALSASDIYGATTTYNISYTILDNTTPEITSVISNQYIGDANNSISINLEDYFTDADGEEVSFIVDYSTSYLSQTYSGNKLILNPLKYGLSTCSVTAYDARNAQVTQTFEVMVRDDDNAIDMYPNPVSDKVNFRMGEDIDGTLVVEIYNNNGVKVKTLSLPISTFSPASADVSDLGSGTYVVKMTFGNVVYESNMIKL